MDDKSINFIKYLCFLFLGLSAIFFAYAIITGDQLVLPWEVSTTFKTRPLLLEYFQLAGQPSGLYVDQLISWQKFETGDLQFIGWPQNVLLIVFLFSLIIVTAMVSYLDRFSYFVVSGVIVFVLIQLRLEELGAWDPYLNYGSILGYAVITYLFQSFYPNTRLLKRLFVSILFYALLATIVFVVPNMEYPHWVALSFGIFGPVILVAIFIIFIAGDNIYTLFKITTQGASNGKNGLLHFGVIGLIYVILTALIFAQRLGYTEIDLYLINPYTFLTFSIISGFIALEKKLSDFSSGYQLQLIKNWLYPVGAALTLSLIAYVNITVNDSLTNAIEWVLIISHFVYGATFFVYALINFTPPLMENLSIWPVFFKGLRTPILMVRLMSFILFLGGIFYLEYRPYYQVKAGQFTMLADIAKEMENELLTDQYYRQSVYYDFYNFKANYALTRVAKRQQDVEEVPQKLNSILTGSQNPKARIAFANFYADRDLLYNEITSLMNSPEADFSGEVQNNLGLSHYRYSNYDSAYKYFELSQNSASIVSETNLAALNYDLAAQINFDTTINYKNLENINIRINRQALANAQHVPIDFDLDLDKDTLLQRDQLFYLYNAALSPVKEGKEAILSTIDYYLSSIKNNQFSNFLLIAKSVALYGIEEVNQAFKTLDQAIAASQGAAGFPYFAKAVWTFDQGQADLCIQNLEYAQKSGYADPQLKTFIEDIRQIQDYQQKADISALLLTLESQKPTLDSITYRTELIEIASKNAFDEATTLSAMTLLSQVNVDSNEIYALLLEATEVNPMSSNILEQYIYMCAKTGLRTFGETALTKFKGMVETSRYNQVREQFRKEIEARRNKFLN